MTDTGKILKSLLADFAEILIIGIAVFALAWIFLAEPLEVSGDSMAPNLHDKEQIIVEKVSMTFNEIQRGDVIVFNNPENPKVLVVKRAIGLPGETFVIENGHVFINNNQLNEPYLLDNTETTGERVLREGQMVEVPENMYILLGDNRSNSTDSRDFGMIEKNEIVGRAIFVYYPVSEFRKINRVQ